MSDFPTKAADETNTLGVLVVGFASAAVVWATVIALQAYFESSYGDLATERDYKNQGVELKSLLAEQRMDLAGKGTLKRLAMKEAKAAVLRDANGPTMIPKLGALNTPTIPAQPGKPSMTPPAAPAPGSKSDELRKEIDEIRQKQNEIQERLENMPGAGSKMPVAPEGAPKKPDTPPAPSPAGGPPANKPAPPATQPAPAPKPGPGTPVQPANPPKPAEVPKPPKPAPSPQPAPGGANP
jgi:hypothetical protein